MVVEPEAASKVTNGSCLPAMVYSYGGPFWFAGFLQMLIIVLTFMSPLLLNQLISLVTRWTLIENGIIEGEKIFWHGLAMVLGLFITAFLTAIINGLYFKNTFLVGFRIRTALVSAIYRKALRISSNAKKDTTVGEVVNLMAVDAQRFFELVSYVHILWSGPLIIGIAIWLIWQQLNFGVIAGIVVMILITPLSGIIATKLRDLQIIQMKIKDERVKTMNEILNGMKVLKLYAWEPSFQNLVLDIRGREMVVMRSAAVLNAVRSHIITSFHFISQLLSRREHTLYGHWHHSLFNSLHISHTFCSVAILMQTKLLSLLHFSIFCDSQWQCVSISITWKLSSSQLCMLFFVCKNSPDDDCIHGTVLG